MADLRKLAEQPNPPEAGKINREATAKILALREGLPSEIPNGAYDTIYQSTPTRWPPSPSDIRQGFLELLFWRRFREPLSRAVEASQHGDLKALRRIHRVMEEYHQIRFGKGPLKGFKQDLDHAALLEMGMHMGLDKLTAEELAECFDEVCLCGKEIHDADALKKQRDRLKKTLHAAERPRAPQNSRDSGV